MLGTLQDGIFSPELEESPLASAHKVLVRYCSSDAHMGNRTDSVLGWHFRGAAIVEAVLADLIARQGLGSVFATTLVFGGASAGGRGAMVTLDFVPALLPSNVRVLGFLDSPYWIDMAPYSGSGFVGFANMTQQAFVLGNMTGRVTANCAEMYPVEELWRCVFGVYRLPFLHTPYLLVASAFDAFQLSENIGHEPRTQAEESYALTFANATRSHMRQLPQPLLYTSGIFSVACYTHAVSASPSYYTSWVAMPDGRHMTQRNATVAFLSNFTGMDGNVWMEPCASSFACGPGCQP